MNPLPLNNRPERENSYIALHQMLQNILVKDPSKGIFKTILEEPELITTKYDNLINFFKFLGINVITDNFSTTDMLSTETRVPFKRISKMRLSDLIPIFIKLNKLFPNFGYDKFTDVKTTNSLIILSTSVIAEKIDPDNNDAVNGFWNQDINKEG